jgi:hypothetical protein
MSEQRQTSPKHKSRHYLKGDPLVALTLAPAAQAWLERTTSARVLHVFDAACNLINPQGEILSLVTAPIGAGPFTVVVEAPLTPDGGMMRFTDLVQAGQEVTVRLAPPQPAPDHSDPGARDSETLAIDTHEAKIWQPRPAWDELAGQVGQLKAQLALLETLLKVHAPPGSFAPLLEAPSPDDGQTAPSFEMRFLEAAREPAHALRDGILDNNLDACRASASKLAGLGSGLTPSGDDFMMGVLYALWATRPSEEIGPFAEAIIDSAVPRTVPLSAAWLGAAARGEAGQLWHALVDALAAADEPALTTAARPIIRTGHTSGADALAGFCYMVRGL